MAPCVYVGEHMWYNVHTCDVDLSGVIALLPVGGDSGPIVDAGGLPDVPLNTSSSFCVSCAKPCAAEQVETITYYIYHIW